MEKYGKYGKIWKNMGRYMEKYGKIWEDMETYGKIYGKIWENMEKYGKIYGKNPTNNNDSKNNPGDLGSSMGMYSAETNPHPGGPPKPWDVLSKIDSTLW